MYFLEYDSIAEVYIIYLLEDSKLKFISMYLDGMEALKDLESLVLKKANTV